MDSMAEPKWDCKAIPLHFRVSLSWAWRGLSSGVVEADNVVFILY